MKKVFIFITSTMLMASLSSCGNKTEQSAEIKDTVTTEQTSEKAKADELPASLADLVAKAKSDGANWTEDEWKAQFRKAIEAYKPHAVAMNNAKPADIEKVSKEFEAQLNLIKEFSMLAKSSKGGKGIDDAWIEQTMKELEVPHL